MGIVVIGIGVIGYPMGVIGADPPPTGMGVIGMKPGITRGEV